jgi:hypothetical protein
MKLTIALLFTLLVCTANISGQGTEFTYQGSLKDGVLPANGSYDFKFRLFDVVSGGTEIASKDADGIAVANGIFTVRLDFGSTAFREAPRFLEILVKPAGGPTFIVLTPRQLVTSTPHAIKSLSADTAQSAFFANTATDATNATNAAQLGGIAAGQYVVTTDPRMTDARNPLPNSANYVQNTASPQATSNFNISGNGVAEVLSARSQFNIGNNRVLSIPGSANTFVGLLAGTASTGNSNSFFGQSAGGGPTNSGSANSFFGERAGALNSTGFANSFFGSAAGVNNSTGGANAFFGVSAGSSNTTAGDNSFFGAQAGFSNQTGTRNSFFGRGAGLANTASDNSFFGAYAGDATTSGGTNAFFGANAGGANTTGGGNTFIGFKAGELNTTGGLNIIIGSNAGDLNTDGIANVLIGNNAGNSNTSGNFNTVIGFGADVASNDLQFATAIGANAVVTENNTIVIGRATDKTSVSVLQITGGSDLAENFEIDGKAKPGMVVAIDPNSAGQMVVSRGAYNRRVAGIISGANKLSTGMLLPNLDRSKPSSPIALAGRVWVFADASTGAIKPGDLLTTSSTAGHAMKVKNYRRAQGAIIGKAMSGLVSGRGMVLVLVSMQ